MGSMNFVEEIDYSEIMVLEMVGKGSFGVVSKAKWRDKTVAVKKINTELEKRAFLVELRQLSRVDHPHIVKLYGACQGREVCLVMEYAEGGSLYNVLHGNARPAYTAAHAISWALQCAKGVAYLHGMKPRALIHRDLKPPKLLSLLLIDGGILLKICDFGTACDAQTHMTNNKGSAAWMAPEVFEGSNYSEKCDIFSWGIILWEVISRQKPFDDIRGSAYQILWAVHSGKRPPLIKGCPEELESLMKRCWSREPHLRPSMDEVVEIMSFLFGYFKGFDQPIVYPKVIDEGDDEEEEDDESGETYDSEKVTFGSNNGRQAVVGTSSSDHSTPKDTRSSVGSSETLSSSLCNPPIYSMTSPPPSLVASAEDVRLNSENTLESIVAPLNQFKLGVAENQLKAKPGHKRTGSHGSNFGLLTPKPEDIVPKIEDRRRKSEDLPNLKIEQVCSKSEAKVPPPIQRGGDANSCYTTSNPYKCIAFKGLLTFMKVPSTSSLKEGAAAINVSPFDSSSPYKRLEPSRDMFDNAYRLLDAHLQPIMPDQNSKESKYIFEEHKKCAYNLLIYKVEQQLLRQRKADLEMKLKGTPHRDALLQEYENLSQEKEGLIELYKNLEQQLAMTRKKLNN